MDYSLAKNFLRRHLDDGSLYGYARRLLLLCQYVLRIPDEPDFWVFKNLGCAGDGILVDVGANAGQSAIAFAFICPNSRIISFEPNPALWRDLDFVKSLLGDRFQYHRFGLADQYGTCPLHVPALGELQITSRGSLSREVSEGELQKLERETGRKGSVCSLEVTIKPFDDLDIRPDVVKIDVEGFELAVLKGMSKTIERCSPLIMLERNKDSQACKDFLRRYSYAFYQYDARQRTLIREAAEQTSRNWFALPPRLNYRS